MQSRFTWKIGIYFVLKIICTFSDIFEALSNVMLVVSFHLLEKEAFQSGYVFKLLSSVTFLCVIFQDAEVERATTDGNEDEEEKEDDDRSYSDSF